LVAALETDIWYTAFSYSPDFRPYDMVSFVVMVWSIVQDMLTDRAVMAARADLTARAYIRPLSVST